MRFLYYTDKEKDMPEKTKWFTEIKGCLKHVM